MALTPEEVARLGALARIQLTDTECAELAPELQVILDAVQQVSEVVDPSIPVTTHALPLSNVFRDDEISPSLGVDQALSGAPRRDEDRFQVPQILGEQ